MQTTIDPNKFVEGKSCAAASIKLRKSACHDDLSNEYYKILKQLIASHLQTLFKPGIQAQNPPDYFNVTWFILLPKSEKDVKSKSLY